MRKRLRFRRASASRERPTLRARRTRSRGRPLFPEFVEMLSALFAEGARFLVVGGYAVGVHHVPRATKDLDLLIARDPRNAKRVLRALDAFGAPRRGLTVADLTSPDLVFQIGVAPCRIDLLTSISGVEFEDAWNDRIEATLPNLDVPVPVIGKATLLQNKRAAGRPQDLVDVANMESSFPRAPRKAKGLGNTKAGKRARRR